MQLLKKIVTSGLMFLGLSSGFMVSALALDDIDWIKSSAEQGELDSQVMLGARYKLGSNGVSQDYVKSTYWYKKAADQGDGISQYSLGYAYLEGQGVRQDYSKAIYWFKKSSDQNIPEAQFDLGRIYSQGLGVHQSQSQAKEWYGKACDNGGQYGCEAYKRLNEQGH